MKQWPFLVNQDCRLNSPLTVHNLIGQRTRVHNRAKLCLRVHIFPIHRTHTHKQKYTTRQKTERNQNRAKHRSTVPHSVHNKSQHNKTKHNKTKQNKTKQNTTAHTVTPQNCSYFVIIQFLSLLIHKSLKAINLQRYKYYNTKRYTITRAQWSTILTEGSIEVNRNDCISRYHTVLSSFPQF